MPTQNPWAWVGMGIGMGMDTQCRALVPTLPTTRRVADITLLKVYMPQ
jgi:hypothetical protein